jgi:CII-binding regulator of phage lambda lysogenization HflD
MGAFWARLLAVERRLEFYRRMIQDLQRTITQLEQQIRDLRGDV